MAASEQDKKMESILKYNRMLQEELANKEGIRNKNSKIQDKHKEIHHDLDDQCSDLNR